MMGAKSTDWHALPVEEVAQLLQTHLVTGLKEAKVFELRKKFGPNELEGQTGENLSTVLLSPLTKGLTVILVLAAAVLYAKGLIVILIPAAVVSCSIPLYALRAVDSIFNIFFGVNVWFCPNELKARKGVSKWTVLLSQFTNGLTVILVLAALASHAVQDHAKKAVLKIAIVVHVNFGFEQDYLAQVVINAVRRMASPTAELIRDGVCFRIWSQLVVPGDVIVFEAGDVVPADCRLVEVLNLEADEAILTGEMLPVAKGVEPIKGDKVSLGDRLNMVYSGTTLTKGRGRGIAIATGLNTEIGENTISIV